jgi:hypothetical protein
MVRSSVMRAGVLVGLLAACKRDDAPPPPTPAVLVLPADAAIDAVALDASVPIDAGAPGGVQGRVRIHPTTPTSAEAAPIVGCVIRARDESQQIERSGTTGKDGTFRIELPAGEYRLDGACLRGVFDCGKPSKKPPLVAIIRSSDDWPSFDLMLQQCKKCLDAGVQISTPDGATAVRDLHVGDSIVVMRAGRRAIATVLAVQRVPAPRAAMVTRLVLADGRVVLASGPHPLADGRMVGDVIVGDTVDGARVVDVASAPYTDAHAYDVLPSIDGAYIADGIPMLSTMRR